MPRRKTGRKRGGQRLIDNPLRLSEALRWYLIDHKLLGLSQNEIGHLYGIPHSTLDYQIQQAKILLCRMDIKEAMYASLPPTPRD